MNLTKSEKLRITTFNIPNFGVSDRVSKRASNRVLNVLSLWQSKPGDLVKLAHLYENLHVQCFFIYFVYYACFTYLHTICLAREVLQTVDRMGFETTISHFVWRWRYH